MIARDAMAFRVHTDEIAAAIERSAAGSGPTRERGGTAATDPNEVSAVGHAEIQAAAVAGREDGPYGSAT